MSSKPLPQAIAGAVVSKVVCIQVFLYSYFLQTWLVLLWCNLAESVQVAFLTEAPWRWLLVLEGDMLIGHVAFQFGFVHGRIVFCRLMQG